MLRVSDGVVQFGEDSINAGCLESNSWIIDDTTYTLSSSKWQEREEGSEWSHLQGTSASSQLCMYTSKENREYRVVANIEFDGNSVEYSSNYFVSVVYKQFDDLEVSSGEIELNGQRYIYCLFLSDTEFDGKKYTVFYSKWQSRADEESPGSDANGTETSGELCALDAVESLEYRLVGSIMVDGDQGHRRSNEMQAESSE